MKPWVILAVTAMGLLSVEAGGMPVRTALGMIETGATTEARCVADQKRGRHREVTRYQILPQVFHRYTRSREYANPDLAWSVAERILVERRQWFAKKTGRRPTDVDLYLMWNAPGLYEKVGFKPQRMPREVRQRAERFSNLRAESAAAR